MRHDVLDDLLKRIGDEEAHRHSRRVGRKPQDVETRVLVTQIGQHGVQVERLSALHFLRMACSVASAFLRPSVRSLPPRHMLGQ